MGVSEEMIRKTLDQIKEAQQLNKAITLSTGLQGYDLEQPARNLYPVLSPIRNMLPRKKAAKGSSAVHWKAITGLSTTGSPFVAEGARNSEIIYTEVDKNASYKTWGRDDSVTREAEQQAMGFEDLRARSARSLLQRVMIEEEDILIGGNTTTALGTTPTPVIANAGTGGNIAAGTYDVICVALPYMGYRSATINQVNSFNHAAKSVASSTTTTSGSTSVISGHVTPVNGAVAYAWFIGTAGAEKCELITTVANFLATTLLGTGQLASAVSADTSADANAYDGLIPQIVAGGYVLSQPNGTDGTGTPLTYDNATGIVEFDKVLKYQWDTNRLSPDIIFVNSQEAMNISLKVLKSSNNPAYQFIVDAGDNQGSLMGSALVTRYFNKFTGTPVKIQTHPTLPAGTVMFFTQNLPSWYVDTNIEGAWDVHLLEDYYELMYALTTRKWEHGIYANGVLRGYIPGAQSLLTNVANG